MGSRRETAGEISKLARREDGHAPGKEALARLNLCANRSRPKQSSQKWLSGCAKKLCANKGIQADIRWTANECLLSGANLTFESRQPRVRPQTLNSEVPLESYITSGPLILTFAKVPAAIRVRMLELDQ